MSAQKIERQTLGKSLESTLIGMPIESSASVIVSSSRDVRGAGRPHTVASQRQPIRVRIRELQGVGYARVQHAGEVGVQPLIARDKLVGKRQPRHQPTLLQP
eukprot:5816175-Pyramimonas_sp.AAC.1